jgi:hypothetical protein
VPAPEELPLIPQTGNLSSERFNHGPTSQSMLVGKLRLELKFKEKKAQTKEKRTIGFRAIVSIVDNLTTGEALPLVP